MGLWSWTKRQIEPSYSELGELIYRLLTEQPDKWVREYRGLTHMDAHLRFWALQYRPHFAWFKTAWHNDSVEISDVLTSDDRSRLNAIAMELFDGVRKEAVIKTVKSALLILDTTAQSLADATKKGDLIAARALADRVIEICSEGS